MLLNYVNQKLIHIKSIEYIFFIFNIIYLLTYIFRNLRSPQDMLTIRD